MGFSISELSGSLSRYGYQKTSAFSCAITLPPAMTGNDIFKETLFRVNSCNTPGINFGMDTIKHRGFGLDEKRPVAVSYTDVSLTIISDGQGEIHKTLSEWGELILPTNSESIGTDNTEYFEYPNNYYGGLELYMHDITGKIHTTYNFVQPYVAEVGTIQMAWENQDQIEIIPVTFTFRRYIKNPKHSGSIS